MIGAGRLAVEDESGKASEYFVSGGFANIREAAVSILPEQCVELARLVAKDARAELDRAGQMPLGSPADRIRRQDAMTIAQAKVRLAK